VSDHFDFLEARDRYVHLQETSAALVDIAKQVIVQAKDVIARSRADMREMQRLNVERIVSSRRRRRNELNGRNDRSARLYLLK